MRGGIRNVSCDLSVGGKAFSRKQPVRRHSKVHASHEATECFNRLQYVNGAKKAPKVVRESGFDVGENMPHLDRSLESI